MAKELVLILKKRYKELTQSKQSDLLPKHATEADLTVGEKSQKKQGSECEQCVDEKPSVQNGKGLIVRKQFIGDGLPGIANRSLRNKRSKKKTNIQWITF